MSLEATPWQTVGPYFQVGLEPMDRAAIAPAEEPGEHVSIKGVVLDGKGAPVPDAVIEIWQANAAAEYPGAGAGRGHAEPATFRGFGRIPTDREGRFRFTTVRPGRVQGPDGAWQSPHLEVRIMMRGLLKDLVTRMYFPDESLAIDPVLQLVAEERRETLIAKPSPSHEATYLTYLWNVELQGARETVFFDY